MPVEKGGLTVREKSVNDLGKGLRSMSAPSGHAPVLQVFIVEVTWSDKSRIPIYRQYSDFTQLHVSAHYCLARCFSDLLHGEQTKFTFVIIRSS